jgi:hypothetical protein
LRVGADSNETLPIHQNNDADDCSCDTNRGFNGAFSGSRSQLRVVISPSGPMRSGGQNRDRGVSTIGIANMIQASMPS